MFIPQNRPINPWVVKIQGLNPRVSDWGFNTASASEVIFTAKTV